MSSLLPGKSHRMMQISLRALMQQDAGRCSKLIHQANTPRHLLSELVEPSCLSLLQSSNCTTLVS